MPKGKSGPPAPFYSHVPPDLPRCLIVADDTAAFAAAVVGLGCDINRAFRATSIEQARDRQRQWALEGKASIILALDQIEGVDGDEDANQGFDGLAQSQAA